MKIKLLHVFLVLLVCSLVLVLPATAVQNGKIAFVSNRDGKAQIYVMNPDGTGQKRLTENPAGDGDPAWSPDGTKIAFASYVDQNNVEIFLMNPDGTGQKRLTDNPLWDRHPAWSPDGTKIAFTSERNKNTDIYVMNADGTGQKRLTDNSSQDDEPAWSPDGSKIAFMSSRDNNEEIYVMNADGSGQKRLTDGSRMNYDPAWSPDGTKIAFSSFFGQDDCQIYVMNKDGTGQKSLTNNPYWDRHPAWSPDGMKIAFASYSTQELCEIYVMNADGSGQKRLTDNTDTDPAWGLVPASITVTSPNGWESWARGTPHTVTWDYTGSPGPYVTIVLLKGVTQTPVGTIKDSTSIGSGGKGSYTWDINPSGTTGSDYKVKISSVSQPTVKDTSNAYFTLTPLPTHSITVTSPHGGETWQRGTPHTITWSYTGSPGSKVKIGLVMGDVYLGIANDVSIGSNGKGSYTWDIPSSGITGSGFKISVYSISQPTIKGISDKPFTLTPAPNTPSITVTVPNGGESWQRGTTHTVTWDYTGDPGPTVMIVLLKAGQPVGTATYSTSIGLNGKGSYSWAISPARAPGTDYQILIQSVSQPSIKDTSDGYFTITSGISIPTPSITVTAPNGGESWKRGTTQTVKWSYTGNPGSYVKIELLKAGVPVGTATYSTSIGSSGIGSYPWAISSGRAPGTNYRIRVTSVSQPTISDSSNGDFTLTL